MPFTAAAFKDESPYHQLFLPLRTLQLAGGFVYHSGEIIGSRMYNGPTIEDAGFIYRDANTL